MLKETIICIVIVVLISLGNYMTQNYTKETVGELSTELWDLKEKVIQQEKEKLKNSLEEIDRQWGKKHEKLAYYIEHDELEKIETELMAMKGNVEIEDYDSLMSGIEKSIFILKHIEEKYDFNLQNIF